MIQQILLKKVDKYIHKYTRWLKVNKYMAKCSHPCAVVLANRPLAAFAIKARKTFADGDGLGITASAHALILASKRGTKLTPRARKVRRTFAFGQAGLRHVASAIVITISLADERRKLAAVTRPVLVAITLKEI